MKRQEQRDDIYIYYVCMRCIYMLYVCECLYDYVYVHVLYKFIWYVAYTFLMPCIRSVHTYSVGTLL